jgi:hypothetical protein
MALKLRQRSARGKVRIVVAFWGNSSQASLKLYLTPILYRYEWNSWKVRATYV